ncbi:hypothetical protein BC833DRAFT_620982 [Globomyces pollinis-pini]|nr:hypothetical protein BC833DRAFT_620982 [Globomyces pollinis-pini]
MESCKDLDDESKYLVGSISFDLHWTDEIVKLDLLNAVRLTMLSHQCLTSKISDKDPLKPHKLEDIDIPLMVYYRNLTVEELENYLKRNLNTPLGKDSLGWKLMAFVGTRWIKDCRPTITIHLIFSIDSMLGNNREVWAITKTFMKSLAGVLKGSKRVSLTSCLPSAGALTLPDEPKAATVQLWEMLMGLFMLVQTLRYSQSRDYKIVRRYDNKIKNAHEDFPVKRKEDMECVNRKEAGINPTADVSRPLAETGLLTLAIQPKEIKLIKEEIKATQVSFSAYLIVLSMVAYRMMLKSFVPKPIPSATRTALLFAYKVAPLLLMGALLLQYGLNSFSWVPGFFLVLFMKWLPSFIFINRLPERQNVAYDLSLTTQGNLETRRQAFGCFGYRITESQSFWNHVHTMQKIINKQIKNSKGFMTVKKLFMGYKLNQYFVEGRDMHDYSVKVINLGELSWQDLEFEEDMFSISNIYGGLTIGKADRQVIQVTTVTIRDKMNTMISFNEEVIKASDVRVFASQFQLGLNQSVRNLNMKIS